MLSPYSIVMFSLIGVLGIAGVVLRLARLGRGGLHPLGGIASLVGLGLMVVVLIYVAIQFHSVSGSIGPGAAYPTFSGGYTPIPWSTVPDFSTPAPGLGG